MKIIFGLTNFVWLVAVVFVFSNGCSTIKPVSEESRMTEIAKKEYGSKPVKVHNVTWEDGYWWVFLIHQPETPGGHSLYKISAEGKVIEVLPGM